MVRDGPWDGAPNYTQRGDFLNTEVNTVTARLVHRLSDSVTLSNAARFGKTGNGYVLTGLRGGAFDPDAGTYDPLTLSTHQGYQEVEYYVDQLNALIDTNLLGLNHELVVGAEFSNLSVDNGTYNIENQGATNCVANGRGGPRPAYCITDENRNLITDDIHNVLQRSISKGDLDSQWQVQTLSAYLNDTVKLTDWLSLHGGVRLDSVDYENKVTGRDGTDTDYAYTENLWNGHAGLSIKPFEETYVYANWGTATNINGGESDLGGNCGYGGICVADGTEIGDGSPERTNSYEIGVKQELFDEKLLLTAAAFQIDKDDVFESAGDGYASGGSLNTGANRVRGIEVGLAGNITPRLSGQIGAAFMDAEITDSNDTDKIGRRLSNFADNQASGQLSFALTNRFSFGGAATYKSSFFTGQPDDAASYNTEIGEYTYEVPDYWTFDTFASYQITPSVSTRVNLTNLTNEDYYLAGYRSGHFLYKGDERRLTWTMSAKF